MKSLTSVSRCFILIQAGSGSVNVVVGCPQCVRLSAVFVRWMSLVAFCFESVVVARDLSVANLIYLDPMAVLPSIPSMRVVLTFLQNLETARVICAIEL